MGDKRGNIVALRQHQHHLQGDFVGNGTQQIAQLVARIRIQPNEGIV